MADEGTSEFVDADCCSVGPRTTTTSPTCIKLFSVPWGYRYLYNCNSCEYVIKHVKLAMFSFLIHIVAILYSVDVCTNWT